MEDVRLGRFMSVDPLTAKFPWYSPYQFAGNDVIRHMDLDGAEPMLPPILGNSGWLVSPQIGLLSESEVVVRPVIEPKVEPRAVPEMQEHHIFPRQFKNNDVVRGARDEGLKFEGAENKLPVEKFNRSSGNGRHGNHPDYNKEVQRRINEFKKDNPNWTKEDALKFIRSQIKDLKQKIEANPDKKVNDLFKAIEPPTSTPRNDNTTVKPPVDPSKVAPPPPEPCDGCI